MMLEVSFFPCSRNMDYEFEYGIPNEGLGSFVHSLLPDSLHIDPSTVSPSPSPLLTQKTIWAFDYRASCDNHLEELQSEDEEYVEDFSDEEYVDEVNPVEEVEEIDSVGQEGSVSDRNQRDFNQLLYRVYTSAFKEWWKWRNELGTFPQVFAVSGSEQEESMCLFKVFG